ncbi:hypothetical protein TNCT_287201 [Trichonephila clavata]|uniref:Uncharacterized protein n=1 Tax=Trichonephila clavata TaxID=2740835 RepID=A0A8X6LYF6_TRICU|nr:hypothetical protein TNCT_287201 [Trichonephila clavata]
MNRTGAMKNICRTCHGHSILSAGSPPRGLFLLLEICVSESLFGSLRKRHYRRTLTYGLLLSTVGFKKGVYGSSTPSVVSAIMDHMSVDDFTVSFLTEAVPGGLGV